MVQSWKNLQLHWTSGNLWNHKKSTIPSYSDQLQELPIKQVLPNPHQPRKVIDPKQSANWLPVFNVRLLQPVVVRTTENG